MNYIQHESFVNLYNKDEIIFDTIFKETLSLSQLSNKIIKVSKNFEKLYYKDADKLKGDLFEIFAECFFKILGPDKRIGVCDYQPEVLEDFGVDGYGTGMDKNPLTVQVKFRSNVTSELKLDDIKNFQGRSNNYYGVPINTRNNLIFFTNAKGLNWITESKVLSGASKTFGYKEISFLVDNNTVFWKYLNDLVKETISYRYGPQ